MLRPNRYFVSPALVIERHRGVGNIAHSRLHLGSHKKHCHFSGKLRKFNGGYLSALAAISTCNGLTGLIQMEDADYLIEPLKGYNTTSPKGNWTTDEVSEPQPHLIYRRSAAFSQFNGRVSRPIGGPLIHDSFHKEHFEAGYRERMKYERRLRRKTSGAGIGSGPSRRRNKRSVSIERNVETLLVADRTMLDYYSNEDIETYLLTVLNMVSTLYHDASIGNAINVVLVKIILLESKEQEKMSQDEEILSSVSDEAELTLKSFCKWQRFVNPSDESHPNHHDVAVLVTRNNICTKGSQPCTTLGLAEVAGMCQPQRSCNVNEDSGLTLAYTIAHEMGHNFGMSHDGPHNGCQAPLGERQHVMAPHLNSDTSPLVWSNCSRQEITNFLDRDWGRCLDDEPLAHNFTFPVLPPGAMYDADHQCRLQYGSEAKYCDGIETLLESPITTTAHNIVLICLLSSRLAEKVSQPIQLTLILWSDNVNGTNYDRPTIIAIIIAPTLDMTEDFGSLFRLIFEVCQTLWCRLNNKCVTKMEPAAEGTVCDKNKWCYLGNCTEMGDRPEAIDGEWGSWSAWGECSRTCGGGVIHAERHCDNPAPAHGGRYCIGERKRYRMCNTEECPEGTPSFRAEQCASFNNLPYKGELFNWSPVSIPAAPCQLHCKPDGKFFSVMLRDTVIDGTPCLPGSRDVCINGRCRSVSCDWGIETSAQEDRCGICHGDGTQCSTVRQMFKTREGLGYAEIGRIPQGARNIRIEEVSESTNYIAIQGSDGEFYLNGEWFIQWSGEYPAAGTTLFYQREGEKELLHAPGPIKEDIIIYLLFQSENPGISIEYTLPQSNATRLPEFEWKYSDWTVCSVTCGGGYQESFAKCMEKEAGLVEDTHCAHAPKPKPVKRTCNIHQCPARWWTGPWQHCSATCGDQGRRKRTVLCVRSLGPDEQLALTDDRCAAVTKPHDLEPCPVTPLCPEDPNWITSEWSDTCRHSPCANQTRDVSCGQIEGCDNGTRPANIRICDPSECGRWNTGAWSECSESCGGGLQVRKVTCSGGNERCALSEQPASVRPCNKNPCPAEEEPSAPQPYDDTEDEERPQEVVEDSKSNLMIYPPGQRTEVQAPGTDPASSNPTWGPGDSQGSDGGREEARRQRVTLEDARYAWRASKWSKCTKGCGGGQRSRHVKCIDKVTQQEQPAETCYKHTRHLKPSDMAACNPEPCLDWEVDEWSKCSARCGNGTRERMVSCPVAHKCDTSLRPSAVMACHGGPCERWVSGAWSDCQGCGQNGTQRRSVQCVNHADNTPAESCSLADKPAQEQICEGAPCTTESEAAEFRVCVDELTYQECQNFKHLCDTKATPYFRLKCCHTCSLYLNRTFNE
ncbi:A disintegrin and metalloproteinase with thrombospondin motifs 7-like isoform X5 [Varroa destructor]|nr:A disintegrin and metalloproteinase with thrombospondin motifs 7-like isoform X5 [Varroa destructor]XP_022672219.1 A disintegrin and metalloproteinase with thrombospondin motifs 7-like isoform X5 [Varroa destructor]